MIISFNTWMIERPSYDGVQNPGTSTVPCKVWDSSIFLEGANLLSQWRSKYSPLQTVLWVNLIWTFRKSFKMPLSWMSFFSYASWMMSCWFGMSWILFWDETNVRSWVDDPSSRPQNLDCGIVTEAPRSTLNLCCWAILKSTVDGNCSLTALDQWQILLETFFRAAWLWCTPSPCWSLQIPLRGECDLDGVALFFWVLAASSSETRYPARQKRRSYIFLLYPPDFLVFRIPSRQRSVRAISKARFYRERAHGMFFWFQKQRLFVPSRFPFLQHGVSSTYCRGPSFQKC